MKKKVLIVSASAGAGHTTSANAIKDSIDTQFGNYIETTHIDILDYTTRIMRKVYKDLYLYLAKKKPLIYGMIYKYTDNEHFKSGLMDWINTKKFRKYITKNRYDFIVSTHFLPSNILSRMKKKGKISTPIMNVLTDFGAHVIWLASTDYCIVPDEQNLEYFKTQGISKDHIYDFGIPIKTVFSMEKSRKTLREKFGLDDKKNTILILSGGFGVGPIEEIIKNLELITSPIEVIVICGKNEKLYNDCEILKEKLSYRLIPVGFTTDMDEYMKASDLLITKPGGLTIAEALASNIPIVILNPIIGQEDKNADKLLEEGCAIKITYIPIAYFKIEKLLSDKSKLSQMKTNITNLSKPDAAKNISELIHKELISKNSFSK